MRKFVFLDHDLKLIFQTDTLPIWQTLIDWIGIAWIGIAWIGIVWIRSGSLTLNSVYRKVTSINACYKFKKKHFWPKGHSTKASKTRLVLPTIRYSLDMENAGKLICPIWLGLG